MFVTIEGPDGAGKSTVIDAIRGEFPDATYTKEPNDDTWIGQHVRDVIDDPDAPAMAIFFAFLEDHAYHIENVVKPALDNGNLVICDRAIDSRYAYQSESLEDVIDGDPLPWIRSIQEAGWTRFPELTLLIDVPAEEGLRRVTERGEKKDRFEKLDKQQRIRETYLELAEEFDDRYVVIDGVQSDDVEENKRLVAQDCIDAIRERLAVA